MTRTIALLLAAATTLAGCSDESSAPANAAMAPKAEARPRAATEIASAQKVAAEARGEVKCPARAGAGEAAGPIVDIVGVRPGMHHDEAANVVLCTHELLVLTPANDRRFRMQTYGREIRHGFNARFARPRVQRTSREIMKELQDGAMARGSNRTVRDVQPGESKWYVGAMGTPGEERVISASREEWFAQGRSPTVASVVQALIEKYGPPTRSSLARQRHSLRWVYDPLGRRVGEGSPLSDCAGAADPDAGTQFSPECGVVVAAMIGAVPDNPQLAQYLQVGVIDQAGGYAAVSATERSLERLDAQRRAQEVEAAARNAAAPQL